MKRLSVACLLSLLPHAPAAAQLQFTKLLASDGEADDRFGVTVATNGRLVAAGAPFADVGGDDAAAAYNFRRSGADWTEQAKLVATDGAAGDLFGSAVDLGRDLVVLGAPQAEGAGAAYVFRLDRATMVWSEEAKLVASDAGPGDEFGRAVAIDGEIAAVGAPGKGGSLAGAGRVYVYEAIGGSWLETAVLESPNATLDGEFGQSVALSEDTLIVGAWLEDELGINSGAGYAFRRDPTGGEWALEGVLTAPDADSGDVLGYSAAVDGDLAVLGALAADLPGAFDTGAAYVFSRQRGAWTVGAKLTADDAEDFDAFGGSLAVEDGLVLVGALLEDDCPTLAFCDTGAVYAFRFDGVSADQVAKLTAPDASERDMFGVAVSQARGSIVVGAFRSDDQGLDAGAVYALAAGD